MSMLSAQCDELRAMAESVGLAMPQAATLMMDAADTITELRGALQVASVDYRHLAAENAKLRELVSVMPRCWNADCDGCPMASGKTVYGYGAERCIAEDKLRELGVEV